MLRKFLVAGFCAVAAAAVHATSIRPPTLDELIAQSTRVVEVVATNTTSYWEHTTEGRIIRTKIQFEVLDPILGPNGKDLTLTFLGGTIGNRSMSVAGQPRFQTGETSILFIEQTDNAFCPVTRMAYGRFRLASTDAGKTQQVVLRENHHPLHHADQIKEEMHSDDRITPQETASGMTVEAFKAQIRERAKHLPQFLANPR